MDYTLFMLELEEEFKGKDSEVSIYSGIDLSPKQFSGGGISNKTPNYTDKNRG